MQICYIMIISLSTEKWKSNLLAAIQEEKIDSRAEVKEFSKDQLKHVDTVEKNPLPTAGGNGN